MIAAPVDNSAIEDALSIIGENGGLGEFESDNSGVDRWLFPRFPGAEHIGTCLDAEGNVPKAKGHKGIHVQNSKCGENFAPDMGNMYLSRTGIGGIDSDVETIAEWMSAPRNVVGAVLLLSDPGTGKTALVEAAGTHAEAKIMTVLCTPDHNKDSLFIKFMGEGLGDCITPEHEHGEGHADYTDACERAAFSLGPIPYAAKHGYWLYMDEVMLLLDGVKPVLYAPADGRRFLPEGNLDGSPMEIHPNFRLILSSNPLVRGASLPEPIASRCASTTMHIETSAAMLRDLGIDEAIVAAWEGLGSANLWRPQIREMRVADYWYGRNTDQAISAFLPEHCPESERSEVYEMVRSYLGSGDNINAAGRLVVK
jgi:hypothetical protein